CGFHQSSSSSSSSLSHRSFPAPTHAWSGRIWARTGYAPAGRARQLRCATGGSSAGASAARCPPRWCRSPSTTAAMTSRPTG
uniref:Uncharacterized protein n=1 Tax=Aegilops tauschii subsp. strangulata TaxID=200361 RepID=A0A453DC73_AEGTS